MGMKEDSMTNIIPIIAALALCQPALARHVTHAVTPANIDRQPLRFAVKIKDVGDAKEFVITVKGAVGAPNMRPSPSGWAELKPAPKKQPTGIAVTQTSADGALAYTFHVANVDADRAEFTFTETPQGPLVPFAGPGDYWKFDLAEFAKAASKAGR
jgi:hypothetical protein